MPPWRTPEAESYFNLKFIRIRRDISVGRTLKDNHLDIAMLDGLMPALNSLRAQDPAEADAGLVMVKSPSRIYILDRSTTLDLGYSEEAREITIKDFQEQNPNHTIIKF